MHISMYATCISSKHCDLGHDPVVVPLSSSRVGFSASSPHLLCFFAAPRHSVSPPPPPPSSLRGRCTVVSYRHLVRSPLPPPLRSLSPPQGRPQRLDLLCPPSTNCSSTCTASTRCCLPSTLFPAAASRSAPPAATLGRRCRLHQGRRRRRQSMSLPDQAAASSLCVLVGFLSWAYV